MADNDTTDPRGIRTSMIRNFVESEEFRLIHGEPTNAQFVAMVYREILGREASQAEINFQVGAMGCATARCVDKQVAMLLDTILTPESKARSDAELVALLMHHAFLLREGHPTLDIDTFEQSIRTGGKSIQQAIAETVRKPEFEALYK